MYPVDQYLQQTTAYVDQIFSANYPSFLLPNLQRSYKWDKSKIRQLWKDLSDYRVVNRLGKSFDYTHNNPDFDKTPPYLLGTIYIIEDTNDASRKKVRQLIDGQQRLTTICLSVLVWIEIYHSLLDDPKIKEQIDALDERLDFGCQDLLHKAKDILTERKTPKLIYPQHANNVFWAGLCKCSTAAEFTKHLKTADENNETQKNIVAAFAELRSCMAQAIDDFPEDAPTIAWKNKKDSWDVSKVKTIIKQKRTAGFEEWMTRFAGLLATLLDCVCLVQFKCTATQQVSLFDIINNRGAKFDMPDMVRLMLFSRVKQSKHEELNRIWTTAKINPTILSWVWNAFYAEDEKDGARNKLELQVEDRLSSGMSDSQKEKWVMDFASRCTQCALSLSNIASFSEVSISEDKFSKVAFVTSFDYAKFTNPIYFALEEYIKDDSLARRIYSYLLNLIIRITIVKQKDTRIVSKTLPGLAINICREVKVYAEKKAAVASTSDESLKEEFKSTDLLETIKELVKNSSIYDLVVDGEFKQKLIEYALPNDMTRFGYLVIASIENSMYGKNSASVLKYYGKVQEQNNNLEHIYPQIPDQSFWPDYQKSYTDYFIGKIGNLLPLASTMNSSCSNKSISDKMKAYGQSGLKLYDPLKELIDQQVGQSAPGTWTVEKIEKRTEQLAEKAVVVFSLN